jgi:pimeloyl-ACP methyl ester carboxylesterase
MLHYEVFGEGPPIIITPGGRLGRDFVRPLGEKLGKHFQVILWDRRNTGAADVYIDGRGSEQEIWSDDLAGLLKHLDVAPAWVAGGSAGCRVSLLAAIRHPEVVKGLVLWSASGGAYGSTFLGYTYHVPYVEAARRGGMAAVIETPFFAERIAANPSNRERLLAMKPERFIEVMKRWNEYFTYRPDTPVVGATEEQLRAIEVPTLIFEGNDDIHPPEPAEAIHRLIGGSQFVRSPWSGEEWRAGPLPQLYTRLAPEIVQFIRNAEAG